MFFVNTAPNAWSTYMSVGGQTLGPQNLTFSSNGTLATPATGQVPYGTFTPTNGAAPTTLTFDFKQTTQESSTFGVTSITQNGYAPGQLSTVSIDSTGIVSAVYTNGQSAQLGQIAMANFPNPQGLAQLGDTNWASTYQSGVPVQGTAGSAGFGNLQSGALESSNVDLTTELVNMITAQRAFDSNAQVITTANQLSQTVINITH
jgi:flagellar hook protein FlgE